MKKIIAALLFTLLILIGCTYIFIPNHLKISKSIVINCTQNGLYRYIADENKWNLWWPKNEGDDTGSRNNKNNSITYNKDGYLLSQKFLNGVEITIEHKGLQYKSMFTLLSKGADSAMTNWECPIPQAGMNPIKRFLQYEEAVSIKRNMDAILEKLRLFAEKKENIYGIDIIESSTTDTVLVATKHITSSYPSTKEIYSLLDPLKDYLTKSGASQTGSPMVNVTKLNDKEFQTMVAIPTDKELPAHENIFPKKMIPGMFMIAEIKGGDSTIKEAFKQMQNYFDDYNKTSMAIPYQQLITDRIKEPDTAKWATKIYAPVLK